MNLPHHTEAPHPADEWIATDCMFSTEERRLMSPGMRRRMRAAWNAGYEAACRDATERDEQ